MPQAHWQEQLPGQTHSLSGPRFAVELEQQLAQVLLFEHQQQLPLRAEPLLQLWHGLLHQHAQWPLPPCLAQPHSPDALQQHACFLPHPHQTNGTGYSS